MKLIITEDCRVLGQGFSPKKKPVEVDDAVAAILLKEGFAVVSDKEAAIVATDESTKE